MRFDFEEFIKQRSVTALMRGKAPVRADAPRSAAYDWGGHNPATPMAEMQYNYYWTVWPVVTFVAMQTLTMMIK